MKARSVIIDDNVFMATVLMDLLSEHHPEIEVLGVAHNGKEGLGLTTW
jgi:chemotaxis response regulator CheB